MFSSSPASAQTYKNVGLETGVFEATPHKLILMLFDGASLHLSSAIAGMRNNDAKLKGESISHVIDIISKGLQASLDTEAGGELAARLNALYDYMCARLLHANLRNDLAALEEVGRLLNEIRSAWCEIADDPAVVSAGKKVA